MTTEDRRNMSSLVAELNILKMRLARINSELQDIKNSQDFRVLVSEGKDTWLTPSLGRIWKLSSDTGAF